MPRSYGNIGLYITSKNDISQIYLENEIVLEKREYINTLSNDLAFLLFDKETQETGFIP